MNIKSESLKRKQLSVPSFLTEEAEEKKQKVVESIPLISKNIYSAVPKQTEPLAYGLNLKTVVGSKPNSGIIAESKLESSRKQLPILAQNIIPGLSSHTSEKSKYLHDLSHRPDDEGLDMFERVPVEQFGMALLKGMGWKEGKAIGNKEGGLVKPIDLLQRPSLLGLGATPNPMDQAQTKKKQMLPGDKASSSAETKAVKLPPPRNPISKALVSGMRVKILEGRYKNQTGKIIETTQKTDGIAVKVQLRDEVVRVWDDQLQQIRTYWIRPHIRVRIISKTYKDGLYYYEKCRVQDVISRGLCTLKTAKGVILDHVDQSFLETVIPEIGKQVMIVNPDSKVARFGDLAKLIELDQKKETALLQLESNFEMESFSYNDFSEHAENY